MRIENYLGTTKEEVESKKFNIWIGISLGNSYFSEENVKKYIEWAVKYTKVDVLVVIADKIQAINYEVLDSKSASRSLKLAQKEGNKKFKEIKSILNLLPNEISGQVNVARWEDINKSKYHDYRLNVICEEFNKKKEFYDYICSIIEEARSDRNLTKDKLEGLSDYVLREIPVFINGVKYKLDNGSWRTYNLIPYPGISKLDNLFMGLQDRTIFPNLADKLKITDDIAILEAYVD